MPGHFREIAVRLFAKELRNSDFVYREDEEQYSPQYILTPTGARANRVLISGTMTEIENIGNGTDYYRARISDPTGTFVVYAGQYQPEAVQFLAAAETPSFVTVIGKVSSFKTDDKKVLLSIRPEYMQKTDTDTRDMWIFETAQKTYDRILKMESGNVESTGLSKQDLENVLTHYKPNLKDYKSMVADALEMIS
ncbi:MAG: DNA-binding protein [Methanimicrococcus sp.]|nr:DNA-binding protein [Methanimicrococcus sp.]